MGDLLSRLKAGRAATRTVTLCRGDGAAVELGLRLLSEQDYLEAGIAVLEHFKGAGIVLDIASAELFEAEKATQLLLRALVEPDGAGQAAVSPAQLRQALTREEKLYLIEQYLEFEKTYSPSERTLDAAAFAGLLEEVKKTPGTALLNDSSTATLKRLIAALVAQPAS